MTINQDASGTPSVVFKAEARGQHGSRRAQMTPVMARDSPGRKLPEPPVERPSATTRGANEARPDGVRALGPVAGFLRRLAFLAGVGGALVEHLAQAASVRHYERGEQLWRLGEMPRALLLVKSGMVKLTRPVARGRTALCGLFGPPSCLGELVLVKGVRYQNSALAATSTQIVALPRAEILAALHSEPQLSLNLFCGFEEKLTALHDKIDVLSAGSVEARLATLLVKLYRQFGDDLEDGTSRIGIPLSRQELADMVATSFETGIRVLSRWEREGLLETDAEGFTLRDVAELEELGSAADKTCAGPDSPVS